MGVPEDVLKTVKNKTGKNISFKDVQKVAKGVNPEVIQNEANLRKLIKQVSKMANVPVSEATINEIIQTVRKTGFNPVQLLKLISKK